MGYKNILLASALICCMALCTACGEKGEQDDDRKASGKIPVSSDAVLVENADSEPAEEPQQTFGEEDPLQSKTYDSASICEAVFAYYNDFYKEQYGESYPGLAEVSEESETCVTVQIYEDMDTHTATVAWYDVDPATLLGTDVMTGEEIDFTPYLPAE